MPATAPKNPAAKTAKPAKAAPVEALPVPGRKSQLERRSEAEAKLLEAARQIVARKGWSGMTLADVGESAGYSRGLAAHHFGSKAGLQRALSDYINDNFMAQVMAAPAVKPGLATLRSFIRTYLGRKDWTNTRALLLLMTEAFVEESDAGGGLGEYNRQVVGFLQTQIEAGIEAKEIRADVSAPAGASLVMGALRGVMLQKLTRDSTVDLDVVCKQLIDMVDRSFERPAPKKAG